MDVMDNLQTLTIHAALENLRGRQISPRDLAEACSRQIERLNSKLNAFITVIPPQEAFNAQLPGNDSAASNALRGIPIALKDLFETAGIRTTAGSKFFAEYIPEQDAFVVEKLKQAGAILMGKTNTHEIALGVTGNNPHYGTARNPLGSHAHPRRFLSGVSHRCRNRHGARRPRHRYRRLDPHPGSAVRCGRVQADVWARQPPAGSSRFPGTSITWDH